MRENAPILIGDSTSIVVVENLTRSQLVQYAGASGDVNPFHTDEVFATQVAGFPRVFAHGMLTMGITGTALTDLYGVESLRRFGGRFKAQVWPGDTLTATVTVVGVSGSGDVLEVAVTTTNQDGAVVFEGQASVQRENSTNACC